MTSSRRALRGSGRALAVVVALAFAGAGGRVDAQEPERIPLRLVFLGADGRLIEVPGGLPATATRLVPTGRALATVFAHGLAIERQPLGRGFLGLGVIDLTPELLRHYRVPAESGVMVSAVSEGSPAESAGLRVGDVIVRLEGEAVAGADSFRREVRGRRGGERLRLEYFRGGAAGSTVAAVSERERPLIRLEPALVAPRQLELRVARLDGAGEAVDIRVEEMVEQVQRVLAHGASVEKPLRVQRGADREALERRIRELEREIEELDRRLLAARPGSR
jgi:membrane-associated protease RseP (regulator of RpoE activity)